jgi:hypothetical protein
MSINNLIKPNQKQSIEIRYRNGHLKNSNLLQAFKVLRSRKITKTAGSLEQHKPL